MLEALAIFAERNARYNDGWRKYGAYGGAFFVKDRAERIWESMKSGNFNIEDALDLINLSAFTIRSEREGNHGGEYWKKAEIDMPVGPEIIGAIRAVWGSSGFSPDEKLDRIGRIIEGE
jgi:hypothetical protein